MRIWDIPVEDLCQKHLLGEHRELHAIWTILTQNKKGYIRHPETQRWIGKLGALYKRHTQQVIEMEKRGYKHSSPLEPTLIAGKDLQDEFVNTIPEQKKLLKNKPCNCYISSNTTFGQ